MSNKLKVENHKDFLMKKIVLKQFETVRKELGANSFVWNESKAFRNQEDT